MKVKAKYILILCALALAFPQALLSQARRIDSLKKVLDRTDLADSVRYRALLDYFEAVRFSDPLTALASAKEARSIAEKDGNKKRLASAYSKLGLIYGDLGKLSQAIENQLTALRIYEDLGDTLQIAGMQLNVAIVYEKQMQYSQSVAWLKKSLENFKLQRNRRGEAYVYNNLAIIARHEKHPDEAYDYYVKSLAIKEELHDSSSLGNGYLNMGLICEDREDRKKAMEYYTRALKMYSATHNVKGFAGVYNNIGTLLVDEGKLEKGRDTLLKSLQFARAVRSKEDEQEAHLNLSHVYALLKDYAHALEHYDQYRDCKDSILNEKGAKQIAMLQAVYETDKKDREYESLQKDHLIAEGLIWKGRIMVTGIVAGIALVIVLLVLLVNRARIRDRSNRMLASTNERIDVRKKEITDSISYARRIQDSILPRFERFSDIIPESFLLHKPRQIVSGDFYWVHRKGNILYAAVADNSLHGVPGAFISMVGVNILNSAVEEAGISDLRGLIGYVNKEMEDMIGSDQVRGRRLDFSICRFDMAEKKMEFAGTDNPLYLVNSQGVQEIKGADEKGEPVSKEVQLKKGDTLYMFTDGYADQVGGGEGKKLLTRKVSTILFHNWPVTMSKQKEALFREFEKWRGTLEQVDDVLVMGIRV